MAITVYPDGAIEVVAPNGSDLKGIEARVSRRARWIVKQLLYFDQFRPRSKPRRYVGSETHLYLGRQYKLKLLKGSWDEVKLKGGLLVVMSPRHKNSQYVKRLVDAWYLEKAKARILERFEAIAPRFVARGCRISAPVFRMMPRRWGSYTKTGRVLLNPDLIRAPGGCIDYVITHELAHAVHPNHSVKFYDLLDRLMPDWEVRKARLERLLSS